MKLTEIRIRNFRSIESEQHFSIPGKMTLVGPNNSGKTNILKAIQVFFTGYDNTYGYMREMDLTFGVGAARTSIIATFDGDLITDRAIYEALNELHALQGTTQNGTQITLTLYFTDTNTPVYGFFPNVRRPQAGTQAAQYSKTHKSLVTALLNSYSLHYMPSAKSVEQIYEDLLTPFLRRKVSRVIEPYIADIKQSLADAATALNEELISAQLSGFSASFSLPSESIEELVSGFDFMINDPQKTPIHEKGMGIQTTALLATFRWITKQEMDSGKTVLWLIEEPESYLHPNLATNCNSILENLAEDAIVIKTTHSMAFVPQDPSHVRGTVLNNRNHTEIKEYSSFNESVSSIRTALGIKFGDFYNLSKYNIFVEGKSDREIFQWLIEKIPPEEYAWECLRKANFEDFGGVKHLSGFLRATYQFIKDEQACIAVFDGDDAGEIERRALQNYFGQKDIPFQANEHFVSVRSRFAIEGLFPDQWIISIHSEHPNWFETFSVDASGELEPFKIKDNKKENIQSKLMTIADSQSGIEWANRFCQVCSVLDESLNRLSQGLARRTT